VQQLYYIIINNTENATMHTNTAKPPTRLVVLKAKLANQSVDKASICIVPLKQKRLL